MHNRQVLFAVFIAMLFTSCGPKLIPLKNKYATGNYEIKTQSNFETVWANIISLFAKNGIGVKLIDKSSGFIVAQYSSAPVTIEDKNGKLVDPTAYLVTSKMYDPGPQKIYYPLTANIEWNIYIKSTDGNETLINVNLTSATGGSNYVNGKMISAMYPVGWSTIKSTGVFEKFIADQIK